MRSRILCAAARAGRLDGREVGFLAFVFVSPSYISPHLYLPPFSISCLASSHKHQEGEYLAPPSSISSHFPLLYIINYFCTAKTMMATENPMSYSEFNHNTYQPELSESKKVKLMYTSGMFTCTIVNASYLTLIVRFPQVFRPHSQIK
jgi:hypothetical protein